MDSLACMCPVTYPLIRPDDGSVHSRQVFFECPNCGWVHYPVEYTFNNIYLKHAFQLWCTVDCDRLDLLHCKAPSCVCCALRNKWRTVNAPAALSWKLHSCIVRKSHGRHVALDSPLTSRSWYAEQLNGVPLPGGFECNEVSIVTPRRGFPPCCVQGFGLWSFGSAVEIFVSCCAA